MLSTLSDIFGILSFILTIILLIRSESLRNEIVSQKITYRNQQTEIVKHLTNFRIILINTEPLSLKNISDMRLALEQYKINFGRVLSYRDRKIIEQTLKLLDGNFSDDLRKQLLKNLDRLSARFTKQEV